MVGQGKKGCMRGAGSQFSRMLAGAWAPRDLQEIVMPAEDPGRGQPDASQILHWLWVLVQLLRVMSITEPTAGEKHDLLISYLLLALFCSPQSPCFLLLQYLAQGHTYSIWQGSDVAGAKLSPVLTRTRTASTLLGR